MKLAIIGAGPSGFYAASRLLSIAQSKPLQIHMFDRLGVPHGLVRYGVAPDHPEVKVRCPSPPYSGARMRIQNSELCKQI